jgi:GTA TIM-barrel-like domain/Putative phage tail protein
LRSSANTYPFVTALVTLAAEVKAILPSAKISYGADWSEYFGHQPRDGSGDVYFHLDPLWSSSSIDFIGIDNYQPLSDWRDGTAHVDYASGIRSIYDRNYLKSRITGGENYDWYYASQLDRDAQVRTPIVDGSYGKPWVYRSKDFLNWWKNQHFNRPAGVQSTTATAWVPQSKPIWFTEAGCPAIDKGTNAPNAFYDAKSSESLWPYYSGGQQDAQIQNVFLRVMQDYWEATSAGNPISSVYAAPMVDAKRIFYWAWDARPFPAFPARADVWGDSANYAKGHWLNGRIGAVDLGDLITSIAARFGFVDVDVSGVEGLVDGFVLDRPMSARDAMERLLQSFAIDAVETEGKLKFRARRTLSAVVVASDDLVEENAAQTIINHTRAQETELASAVRLIYAESGLDYRSATVSRQKSGTGSSREINMNLPAALSQAQAQGRVDAVLEEAWAARETAQFTLPPRFEWAEAGDVLSISGALWRVKSIAAGTARKIEAVGHDPAVYEAPPATERLGANVAPQIYGKPDAQIFDLALVASSGSAAPWVAAQESPWPGNLALVKKTGALSFNFNRLLSQQATLGTTLTALPAGAPHRVDYNNSLDVQLRYGALASINADQMLGGGNTAVIGTAATGYEIVQFQKASLIADNVYRINGFLRGQAGSEAEMLTLRPAGQNFILLNAAVVQPDMTLTEAGLEATWRLGPAQFDYGHPSYLEVTYAGQLKSLRPLRPAQIKMMASAGGFNISWIRRTRIDGDLWELAEVPLGEASEQYRLEIYSGATLKRSLLLSEPNYFYTSADFITDFAASPAAVKLRVAQISAMVGAGDTLERIVNA